MEAYIGFIHKQQLIAWGMALASLLFFSTAASAQTSLWTDSANKIKAAPHQGEQGPAPRQVALNLTGMIEHLVQAPQEVARGRGGLPGTELQVDLPHPDGGFETFTVYSTTVMSPELAAKFPDIRTFAGVSLRDPNVSLRLDYTTAGLHAQVLGPVIRWHIDPLSRSTNTQYHSYHAERAIRSGEDFQCLVEGRPDVAASKIEPSYQEKSQARSSGDILRTYRLAVATTGEYGQFHGGTAGSALGAVVTTINRVDGIYQKELAIALTLVGNNDLIVFTNPATDPFTGNNDARILIGESQTVIDTTIYSPNYDVGHTFSTGAGGYAGLGVICNSNSKASGVTGRFNPSGDPFDVDYVAHELGHQFGGNHTFNGSNGACSGGNRNASTAFEPGSGSTIQGYAGICGDDNLQANSDPIFHSQNFDEMRDHVTSGSGAGCGVGTWLGNYIPSVDAGADYTIPNNTPFMLTGSATDTDTDPLTYLWEQRDLGSQQPLTASDDGSIPLFRVFTPTTSPTRFLPRLSTLASGSPSTSEKLPSLARAMDWRLTARDGNGGVNSDNMVVNVDAATGPFALLSPNGGETVSDSVIVTWNVAGTTGAPVNAAQVNFYLSTDSGQSFDLSTPLGVTANDGSATVSFPAALSSSTVRLMIKAEDNIFFDTSDLDFTVVMAGTFPGAPVLTSTTPGDGSATFAFTPGSTGTSPTTSFTAVCDNGATVSGSASPLVLTALTNGTTYSCEVYGSNTSGNGPATTISVTPNLFPAQPTITSIEPEDSGLLVRFSLSNDGGSPITDYTVTCGDISASGDSSPIIILGLTNDQEYSCTVVATNAVGGSNISTSVSGKPEETVVSRLPIAILYQASKSSQSPL